ncbi:MAG: protein kinase domain-containing protein [Chromatiales bacterium]
MANTPERIGKYEVTGIAGKGAMGVVYVGRDPFLDRGVAIKVATHADDTSTKGRLAKKLFLNEAQTAGQLDHPNILKVFDAGELEGGAFFMVMEYIEGATTLREMCDPNRLPPIDTALGYFRQCADALDYAHRHGIIHRDIKPSNLMLTQDGRIKIGDFGIARRTMGEHTQVLGWFGSPMYMSPEQARDEELSGQSDLFSFGVVMYQLLTGRPPFEGRGISGLIQHVLQHEPTPVRELRSQVPEKLAAIVHRCLEKSRDRRYRTGAEILADLNAVQGAGVEAVEPSAADKLRILKSLAFFEGFSDAMIGEVVKVGSWLTYPAGHVLIREGGEETGFYVIVYGQLSVMREDQVIGGVDVGECVGEISYLTEQKVKQTATVTALTKVVVLHITAKMTEWASLPLQMRLNKAFQQVLITRVIRANDRLVRRSVRPGESTFGGSTTQSKLEQSQGPTSEPSAAGADSGNRDLVAKS